MASNDIEITDPQKIIDVTEEALNKFKAARAKLNQVSIRFTDIIDSLNINNLKDGTILRERMKEAVIRSST